MDWRVLIARRSPSAKYHVSLVYWIEIWHANTTGLGKEGMEAFVDSLSDNEKEQLLTKKSRWPWRHAHTVEASRGGGIIECDSTEETTV